MEQVARADETAGRTVRDRQGFVRRERGGNGRGAGEADRLRRQRTEQCQEQQVVAGVEEVGGPGQGQGDDAGGLRRPRVSDAGQGPDGGGGQGGEGPGAEGPQGLGVPSKRAEQSDQQGEDEGRGQAPAEPTIWNEDLGQTSEGQCRNCGETGDGGESDQLPRIAVG